MTHPRYTENQGVTDFSVTPFSLSGKQWENTTRLKSKRLGITVFQPRLKVCTFARTNYYEYGKQRQVQESP